MIYKNINILLFTIILSIFNNGYSQKKLNNNPFKRLLDEHNNYISKPSNNYILNNSIKVDYYQNLYVNSNLPNFENLNGFYFPKGFGGYSGLLFQLKSKNLYFSVEPNLFLSKKYNISPPSKEGLFSVSNDIELINNKHYKNIRNLGFAINFNKYSIGYGNWNNWWGPAIHNSLLMSNNSTGFFYYYFGSNGFNKLNSKIKYKFTYEFSDGINNSNGVDFFITTMNGIVRYNKLEFGYSKQVTSGGYNEHNWKLFNAAQVIITNKNIKYWDYITDIYLQYSSNDNGLKIFIEHGYPNKTYTNIDPEIYSDNGRGSIIGLRKNGLFNHKEIIFGFEYTRLLQGIFYNMIPTPNWYDNIKYDYSSYSGRRWASHSGPDSDDFLIFLGYINNQIGIIYGLNYERHGVTYHFPPEVKFENRISFNYKIKHLNLFIRYENEYFEHYGFVDSNINVWNETFELGSIQRTKTLLFSIEYNIY